MHFVEQSCTLCAGKMFSFFCVLEELKCLAAALYSYSPNLEEMAQCSMITPLTFSQTVSETTSRGHALLQGELCTLRFCFFETAQENSANSPSWCHSRHIHHAWERCSDVAGVDGRQLVSNRSQMTTPISATRRNLVCVGNCK